MLPAFDAGTDLDRRRLLQLLASGGAGLAGCGMGGDDEAVTTTAPRTTRSSSPPPTTEATPTNPPPSTSTTQEPSTTTGGLVENRTWRVHVPPPTPPDAHYNPLGNDDPGSDAFWYAGEETMRLSLFRRSVIDLQFRGEAAREWNYRDGVLSVDLHEDLYWASDAADARSPLNVTAADWTAANAALVDAEPGLRLERRGDYGFDVYFDEPISLRHALDGVVLGNGYAVPYNRAYWREYVERIRDASSADAARDVRVEARARTVTSPHPVTNGPFRVEGVTEDGWQLTLREDEERRPRWVDQLTFPHAAVVVQPDVQRQTAAFRERRLQFAGVQPKTREHYLGPYFPEYPEPFDPSVIDMDVSFDTETLTLPRTWAPGAYVMNVHRPPADNVHFRRALAYLLDRTAHRTRFMDVDRVITGFTTEADERRFLSSSFLELLRDGPHDNYGHDAVMVERASAELRAGGFEQDSEGRWLHQSGDAAGEPISLEIPTLPWLGRLVESSTSFTEALGTFGIEATVSTAESWRDLYGGTGAPPFSVGLGYWGGRLPYLVYNHAFFHGRAWYPSYGGNEPWHGPAVGSFATPPDAAGDATTTVDIEGIIERFPMLEGGALHEAVDRLAWVYNQSLPRIPIGQMPWVWTVDAGAWDWPLPAAEHPDSWLSTPRRAVWQRGTIDAVRTGAE